MTSNLKIQIGIFFTEEIISFIYMLSINALNLMKYNESYCYTSDADMLLGKLYILIIHLSHRKYCYVIINIPKKIQIVHF